MEFSYKCTVREIVGDYAVIVSESGNERQVALALLPGDISEGDQLVFENFEYHKA